MAKICFVQTFVRIGIKSVKLFTWSDTAPESEKITSPKTAAGSPSLSAFTLKPCCEVACAGAFFGFQLQLNQERINSETECFMPKFSTVCEKTCALSDKMGQMQGLQMQKKRSIVLTLWSWTPS